MKAYKIHWKVDEVVHYCYLEGTQLRMLAIREADKRKLVPNCQEVWVVRCNWPEGLSQVVYRSTRQPGSFGVVWNTGGQSKC